MPLPNTLPPSPSRSQAENPSARLSLAIMELDKLIIRLNHIGRTTDYPLSSTPGILYLPRDSEPSKASTQRD